MHGHRRTRQKNAEELLAEALEALRAVRGNYKAWRELWPDQQAKVTAAGAIIETELNRAA